MKFDSVISAFQLPWKEVMQSRKIPGIVQRKEKRFQSMSFIRYSNPLNDQSYTGGLEIGSGDAFSQLNGAISLRRDAI